ncbi:MAG TPA: hypothetical protein VHR66_24130 [Gemmataceae bacterium]|jgi:hypothetical protein|nr:hypothetical protein [Gemmataceae bacterium]
MMRAIPVLLAVFSFGAASEIRADEIVIDSEYVGAEHTGSNDSGDILSGWVRFQGQIFTTYHVAFLAKPHGSDPMYWMVVASRDVTTDYNGSATVNNLNGTTYYGYPDGWDCRIVVSRTSGPSTYVPFWLTY